MTGTRVSLVCLLASLLASLLAIASCDGGVTNVEDAGVVDAGTLAAIGDACAADDECESGLCDVVGGACVANECETLLEPCSDGDGETFCAGGRCGRTCEPRRALREACDAFSDDGACPLDAACEPGLVCGQRDFFKFGDGICVTPTDRAAGDPCGDDVSSCAEGLACDLPTQQCE